MADRSRPTSSRSTEVLEKPHPGPPPPDRRPVLAAFAIGAALAAAGWLVAQPAGMGAAAHGPSSGAASPLSLILGATSSPTAPVAAQDAPVERKHKNGEQSANLMAGRSVCVRLCDGFFFPVAPVAGSGDLAGHEAACESTCPDAPTALYIEPSGSDKIEDAVSVQGAPYTALPVALRSRTTLDNTCACHRTAQRAYSYSLLRDFTLRKGDAVMTPRGFMVFQGRRQLPFARKDFVALTRASLPNAYRASLLAMERAGPPEEAFGKTAAQLAASPSLRQQN